MTALAQSLRLIGFLLLVSPAETAEPPEYRVTTLAWRADDERDLLAIVRETRPRRPLQQKALIIAFDGKAPREIPLPASSRNRPVIGAWYDAARAVLVTQLQDAQGDNPEIVAYDFGKKRWTDVAYVSCPKVFSLQATPESFELECSPFPGAKPETTARPIRKVRHGLRLPIEAAADIGVFRSRLRSKDGRDAHAEGPQLVLKDAAGNETRLDASALWEKAVK